MPECLVNILKVCGFTSKTVLKNINTETVDHIEKFCNENREFVKSAFIGSLYENMKPFQFIPGHRILLLNIPKYVVSNQSINAYAVSDNYLETYSTIMKSLNENAKKNLNRSDTGNRYNSISTAYAIYLYLMAGKACYESLCANLPLPKADTICKFNSICSQTNIWKHLIYEFMLCHPLVFHINKNKQKIIEGQLRCAELAKYLDGLNVAKRVWICEDGTGINAKIEFDSSTNQLIGIVLPINKCNGLPEPFVYMATSAEDIKRHATKPLSKYLYTVLAQPLHPNIPPFVLQVFGTDNTFESKDVVHRWEYTIQELQKYVTFSVLVCDSLKFPNMV